MIVLTDRMAEVRSATLGFFFRVGARHEPSELSGISHFIEHTVFKGTAKRTALEIAIEQDRLGGNLDAFTTHEETGFAIKVIDDQLPRAFDLMADMLTSPRFDEADLESEQDRRNMAHLVDHIRRQGFDAEGALGFGTPADELVRLTTAHRVDVLVLGTHGHRFFADLALGSTVAPVLHRLTIPVVVVPSGTSR